MSWNYRVIEFTEADGSKFRTIHEVHYDEHGMPNGYSETPACVMAIQKDDGTLEDMGEVLDMMREALEKPVLPASLFDNTDEKMGVET